MSVETNLTTDVVDLQIGDLLYDRLLAGTHNQRVEVQWLGYHQSRRRTYIAGVEERSRHPVQLAYDNGAQVKVFRS